MANLVLDLSLEDAGGVLLVLVRVKIAMVALVRVERLRVLRKLERLCKFET